jgi:biopolymer transport protein ExbD
MDYFGTSHSSGAYLTLDRAMEISGLTLPELKRAVVLGSIKVADIGNTTFVDSLSLGEYLEIHNGMRTVTKDKGSPSVFFEGGNVFEDDNYLDPKEREVFREALARDMTTGARVSVAPYVFVSLLVMVAFVLSLPTSRNSGTENLASAKDYYARASVKEITTESVSAILTETNSAYKNKETDTELEPEGKERKDYFALHRENLGASAVETWFESIKAGINKIAIGVYEAIETVVAPLR